MEKTFEGASYLVRFPALRFPASRPSTSALERRPGSSPRRQVVRQVDDAGGIYRERYLPPGPERGQPRCRRRCRLQARAADATEMISVALPLAGSEALETPERCDKGSHMRYQILGLLLCPVIGVAVDAAEPQFGPVVDPHGFTAEPQFGPVVDPHG